MTTAVNSGDMRANMAREKRNDWKEMKNVEEQKLSGFRGPH